MRVGDRVGSVFERHYSHVGSVRCIEKIESVSTNPNYFVSTDSGDFVLKQNTSADSLYQGRGFERLQVVSRAVYQLSKKGLPVEEILLTDDGEHLVVDEGSVFRLYRFIRGREFNGTLSDIKHAAMAAGRFHTFAGESIEADISSRLRTFHFPYPLTETFGRFESFKGLLSRMGLTAKDLAFIEDMATFSLPFAKESFCPTLINLDFHPGNALYLENDEIMIIDLESIMFGPLFKCLAFSILRFALWSADPDPRVRLADTVRSWTEVYEHEFSIAPDKQIYGRMIYIEIEKIFRIMARIQDTGQYVNFLPNISNRHVPNVQLLAKLVSV